jgi:FdhD protein
MKPPALSIVGWSGSGKTTLLERLVPELRARGLRVGVVKHSSDAHPLHRPGSDSERHSQAGAALVAFATPAGVQLSVPESSEHVLSVLERFADSVDLVLVEGWKYGPLPKLEVWREGMEPPLAASLQEVRAVVSDSPVALPEGVQRLRAEDVQELATFVIRCLSPLVPVLKEETSFRSRPSWSEGVTERIVSRYAAATLAPLPDMDAIAIEEPLEIRILGDTLAVTMRTPGEDRQLATGFLFSEGILHSVEDLGSLFYCGRPGEEGYGNVLEVTPASGVVFDVEKVSASRRGTLTTAACGVCGRRSVEDLMAVCTPVPPGPTVSTAVLAHATERLRDTQRNFARTGGVHAAAALDAHGAVLAAFEDVGRHNAVDKVVGALVLERGLRSARASPGTEPGVKPVLLAVSGRASFEIIQKAAMARIPVVASVSAASSLAIDLARRAGVTLATFVREGRFNVYCHPERLRPE